MKRIAVISLILVLVGFCSQAQEKVYQDDQGTIRWTQTGLPVQIYGANYCLPSACDYRAAAYVDGNHDSMMTEDLDHFKRMGWTGLRLCFWGDCQNTDSVGNLIDNDHLRLFEKLIAECSNRDIYMLLSPIVTYDSRWPEMTDPIDGLFKYFSKDDLILNKKAIDAEKNYIRQLLCHTNRYTGRQIKDEPNLLFIEICNEPPQFPDKPESMTAYINGMVETIKSTGCEKLIFYNVSQNFEVAPIVAASKVDGGSYAWYPNGLSSFRTLEGNPLLCVDRYPQLLDNAMNGKSKIVYEFDATQRHGGLQTAAMVREFVRGGCQFIAMFSYDMLRTASKNIGWNVHFMNMVYTPRKAVSSMIGAEMMKRWTKGETNRFYPANNEFGDFRLSYEEDLALLNSVDTYYHTNNVTDEPKDINSLCHIAGVGSSPMVSYDGNGIYFLDKNDDGSWVLELYPDIIAVGDPYDHPSPYCEKAVTDSRIRMFTVNLPEIEVSGNMYPGKYRIDSSGITRMSDHDAQDLYSQYKGWKSVGANSSIPDLWNYHDWYTTAQTTEATNDIIVILDAAEGLKEIEYSRTFKSPVCSVRLVRESNDLNKAYEMTTEDLTENSDWLTAADVTLQRSIVNALRSHKTLVPHKIKIWAQGISGTQTALINFLDKDGNAFGTTFNLTPEMGLIEIDPSILRPYPATVLPQDWPGVCDYYYPQSISNSLTSPNWDAMEQVQISLRGDLYPDPEKKNKGILLEKIALEY